MKIRYSPAAREDLLTLRQYLTGEFGRTVASRSVRKIISDISALKDNPGLARPLSVKIGRESDCCYYLCGKYSIAIFRQELTSFLVIRILDARTDYVRTIFSE